jgi:hypothetical protein
VLSLVSLTCACRDGARPDNIHPEYDAESGKLRVLRYDSDQDGKTDTVSYMDGSRVLRIEIDKDQDGKVERWEHYGADQKLARVGFSRSNDGVEDAWSYAAPDGSIARIEISTRRDGKVSRVERYTKEQLVSADEDTDGDGVNDKWETFEAGRLSIVAFDSSRRGSPDRRLIYASDGSVRIETDPDGDGVFALPK